MGEREQEAVAEVLDSGRLASGEEVAAFEEEFATHCDATHAVATANGTTALHAAFEALDLDPDAAVVTSPFSFIASANAARLAGLDVVFGDIDAETYNLDPESVERELEERDDVGAILPIHLYGLPADMPRFRELADEYDVALVEDAAQAHGATVDGRPVGQFGDAACFSFYPTKNMTTGEGGMVVTDDPDVDAGVREFINHGRNPAPDAGGYEHRSVGHNFRMTNLAAAIGRTQLEKLPEYTAARRRNAAALSECLDGAVETPTEPDDHEHVYHQYTIRTDDRDELRAYLDEHGVGTGVYYPVCINRQEPYADDSGAAPVAEAAAEEVLSLPVHPTVDEEDVETIADLIGAFEGTDGDAPEVNAGD